nr:MAG: RNA-dependent RNA polymerase [Wufeng shrew permutotetravirus 12]
MQTKVLPLIIEAIHNDTLDALYKEQPELWLSVLKNKEDRYENPIAKTRPYLSLPWHWQALFSCLSQPFCENLMLFHERDGSRNAYGFSYANGGGNKIRDHAMAYCHSPGKATYFVYGDDVDFYININGTIKRLCPDFKQMDGSVDATTIDWTIDYIIHTFEKQYGTTYSNFWKAVAEEWKMFATQPLMLIEGTSVYQKKQRDGLMTGVVGTTLFDTVKSVVAYERYLEALKLHPSLLREEAATEFFLAQGLVIKPGTWRLEAVNTQELHGELWTTQKFLGAQMVYQQHGDHVILAPNLELDDWLKMFITPKRAESKNSSVAKERYLFDRMRGLLTTGAALNEDMYSFFNSQLYEMNPLSFVMEVSAGEGTGAPPELVHITGEDFRYSSSIGWPSPEWVRDLYADPAQKQGISMRPLFKETDKDFQDQYKRPEMQVDAVVVDVQTPMGIEASVVLAGDRVPPPVPAIDFSLMPSTVAQCTHPEPNPRSKIVDVDQPDKEVKQRPSLQDTIRMLMRPQRLASAPVMLRIIEEYLETGKLNDHLSQQLSRPDVLLQLVRFLVEYAPRVFFDDFWATLTQHMIWPLHEMASKLGVNADRLHKEVRDLGYFVVGTKSYPFVIGMPLSGATKTIRLQMQSQESENKEKLVKVKTQLRSTTVEKVPALKKQEQTLHQNITRATQLPAVVMMEKGKRRIPRLKKVPNLVIPVKLPPDVLKNIASDILRHNNIKVTRREERDPEGWSHTFLMNDEPVLVLYRAAGKQSWLTFFNKIVSTYQKDIVKLNKNETWSEQVDREEEIMIRVYKTDSGPVLIQTDRSAQVELLAQHPRLREITMDGFRQTWVSTGGNLQPLSLSTGSMRTRAERLERLLGEPITYEYAPLKTLSERYNLISHYYARQKTKQNPKSRGVRKDHSPRKEKGGQTSPARPQNEDGRIFSASSSRQRLLRNGDDEGRRQAWSRERPSYNKPSSVAGHSGTKRGPIVATMEAYQPPAGSHFQRQQNDGRPVRGVLDSRPGRRSSRSWSGGHRQGNVHGSFHGKSRSSKWQDAHTLPDHSEVVLC